MAQEKILEESKKHRVKAAPSDSGPGDGSPAGGVSQMRGDSVAGGESDVRGVRLPGVQPSSSAAVDEGIRTIPKKVDPRRRFVEYSELGLEERINVLNAFKKLLSKIPSISGIDENTQSIITGHYVEWIESQIRKLLGAPNEGEFSAAEMRALKAFASKIIEKEMIGQNKPSAPSVKPAAPSPATAKKEPLKESINPEKFVKAQIDFLRQLEKMDREGPEY